MGTHRFRRFAAAIAVSTLLSQAAAVAPAFAQAPDGKAMLASADKAAKEKNWAKAQADFKAAHAATPSGQAINGFANASYELKSWGEAYDGYDEFIRSYPDSMGKGARALAEKRLKELETKTGALTILVNESGADVFVDDKKIGTSPVRALWRVGAGPHAIKVTKAGFAPFEKPVDVGPNAKLSVDANLSRASTNGKVVVKEATGQQVRVLVDGVDVGAAPWEGELPAGPHEIAVRNATLGSAPQKVEVQAGQTAEVSVSATSAQGRVEIKTSDGLGNIYIDGKLVGEGQVAQDVAAGSHVIRVTRPGFVPFEKKIDVAEKQSVAEAVTLRQEGQSLEGVKVEEDRPFYGLYGGFGLLGVAQVNGMGTSLEGDACKTQGALSCDAANPLGAGAFGYAGWTWAPVGLELFVGALFDSTKQKAQFPGDPANKNLSPERSEEYTLARVGGVVAIRARATVDGKVARFSFSAGPGYAFKQMFMERKATTPNGYTDRWVPDDDQTNPKETVPNKLHYGSFALVMDAAAHFRISQTTAISVGALGWLETAGGDVAAEADRNRVLSNPTATPPVLGMRQPRFVPADGLQVFIGPFVGMMFGP